MVCIKHNHCLLKTIEIKEVIKNKIINIEGLLINIEYSLIQACHFSQ